METEEPILPTPELISIVPALPYEYKEDDERVNAIIDQVAEFCGKEFTVVPPNPDGEKNPETGEIEGGVPVPLDEEEEEKPKPGDPDFVIDPDDPDKTGQIDPDIPGTQPDDGTSYDTMDKLREEYKAAYEKNQQERAEYWAFLWQVLRLISDVTCWTDSFDDTFIYQHRSQTHTIEQKPRCCPCNGKCAQWTKFKLWYAPVVNCDVASEDITPQEREHRVKPFIGGEFHYVDADGEYQVEKIDQKYLNKHYNVHTQEVTIRAMDFPEILTYSNCDCPQTVDLVLHYNAGYCTIPPALLPLICQLLHKIEDSKQSINDCAGAMTQVAGLLKSKKVGNVQYSWSDKDTELSKTQALFTEIYNIANVAELFAISRCEIINVEEAGDVI